jgi:hypothetical protein
MFTYFIQVFSQIYPGGVTDAEVWFVSDLEQPSENFYRNLVQNDILIYKCSQEEAFGNVVIENKLLNFNPSIYSENLCLRYTSSLENLTGKNNFFVEEPLDNEKSLSHIGTLWRTDFNSPVETDSIIRNFFDLNNKNLYAKEILTDYTSNKNARVNFYNLSNYNIDRKFKSYGQNGETLFYIGKPTIIDTQVNYEDLIYKGLMPEFIIFNRELTNNERIRVSSYLGLKYGLTLSNNRHYLSSENIIFWNNANNSLFANRIFGFGKDNTSSLNQLQSESSHLKNHLVASIGEIAISNIEKQTQINLQNNHFLVFGDNGKKPSLVNENGKKIKFWDKVWLAQRTGIVINEFDTHFKLFLNQEILDYLVSKPRETIWMLHDKHVTNSEVSNFNNESLNYYVGEIDVQQGIANLGV